MLESLILWLGVTDPFFKFLIAFGVLVAIFISSTPLMGFLFGVLLGLFSVSFSFVRKLLFPKRRLVNPLFWPGLKKKKQDNSGLFSFPDNRENGHGEIYFGSRDVENSNQPQGTV